MGIRAVFRFITGRRHLFLSSFGSAVRFLESADQKKIESPRVQKGEPKNKCLEPVINRKTARMPISSGLSGTLRKETVGAQLRTSVVLLSTTKALVSARN
jgi:hypothetical protein